MSNAVGEALYAEIGKIHPELAGKLTGMVLQLGEEECQFCLQDTERLAGAVDHAMGLLDGAGGVTGKAVPEERRIDPEDGKARTLAELKKECQGQYSLKEIEEYWAAMEPFNPAPEASAEDTGNEEPTEEAPAEEAEEIAKAGAEEVVAGLKIFLAELKLDKYYDAAASWCEKNGAANLTEIADNWEDFAEGLGLKNIEKKRLEKGAKDAKDKACQEDPAAKKVNEPAKPVKKAKAKEEEIAAPVTCAAAPSASEEEPEDSPATSSKGSKDDRKGAKEKEAKKENMPPTGEMPRYCSFNDKICPEMASYQKPNDDQMMDMMDEDPKLNTTWGLWEQIAQSADKKGDNFEGSLRKFASFNTVRKFWAFWNHLPQPSKLLEKQKFIREDEGVKNIVEGLMIFREGVKPAWEDPVNASGGHFQIQLRPDIGGGQIDEYWNNIVMGMVLEAIKPSEMITGVRLVDKLSMKGKRMDAAFIRIEVWFSDVENKEAVDQLKRNLNVCLTSKLDGSRAPSAGLKIETKSHITKK